MSPRVKATPVGGAAVGLRDEQGVTHWFEVRWNHEDGGGVVYGAYTADEASDWPDYASPYGWDGG